ncbi:hypothetical protein C4J81_16970 [Deltaproteobacteria bacterium Smac51]|nr:hypothetical protein C4J81_16970 [Deltaproteobacteria bacterium Smac51]
MDGETERQRLGLTAKQLRAKQKPRFLRSGEAAGSGKAAVLQSLPPHNVLDINEALEYNAPRWSMYHLEAFGFERA